MKKKIYVLTLSKTFMKGHPKAGQPTNFKEKYLAGEKIHTIRTGVYWKKVVDEVNAGKAILSVREWSGKPYASKQFEISTHDKLGWQSFEFKYCMKAMAPFINDYPISPDLLCDVAEHDGLKYHDFLNWFKYPNPFSGGIIQFTDFKY